MVDIKKFGMIIYKVYFDINNLLIYVSFILCMCYIVMNFGKIVFRFCSDIGFFLYNVFIVIFDLLKL